MRIVEVRQWRDVRGSQKANYLERLVGMLCVRDGEILENEKEDIDRRKRFMTIGNKICCEWDRKN